LCQENTYLIELVLHSCSILGRLWRQPEQPEAGKSLESEASLCGANSVGDWALYAVSVRRLIALHPGLPLLSVALACGSPYASLQPFKPFLTKTPLPSANTFVNLLNSLTGFTYRELSPHKFMPMPGVHHANSADAKSRVAD